MGEWGIVAALPTIVHHRRMSAANSLNPSIVQCRQFAESAADKYQNPHTHSRPPQTTMPKYAPDSHSPGRPFLRRQESQRATPFSAAFGTQHCEIPAYAGMSYLWTANCGRIRQIRQLSTATSPIVRRHRIVATMI